MQGGDEKANASLLEGDDLAVRTRTADTKTRKPEREGTAPKRANHVWSGTRRGRNASRGVCHGVAQMFGQNCKTRRQHVTALDKKKRERVHLLCSVGNPEETTCWWSPLFDFFGFVYPYSYSPAVLQFTFGEVGANRDSPRRGVGRPRSGPRWGRSAFFSGASPPSAERWSRTFPSPRPRPPG